MTTEPPHPEQQPSVKAEVGARVLYSLAERDHLAHVGEQRPAIVVSVDPTNEALADLRIFTRQAVDGDHSSSGSLWRTGIRYDASRAPGTWQLRPSA